MPIYFSKSQVYLNKYNLNLLRSVPASKSRGILNNSASCFCPRPTKAEPPKKMPGNLNFKDSLNGMYLPN